MEDTPSEAAVIHVTVPSPEDAEFGGEKPSGTTGSASLAFTPFTLAFRRIKYHVPKPAGKVTLGAHTLFPFLVAYDLSRYRIS